MCALGFVPWLRCARGLSGLLYPRADRLEAVAQQALGDSERELSQLEAEGNERIVREEQELREKVSAAEVANWL